MRPLIAALATLALTLPLAAQKREHFEHADVQYDWVTNSQGQKLRTFITRPKNATGKVPVIFFVGWLSCDSMEYPDGDTDGFGAFMRHLIDQSGYATVRMDKPGVGESQGDCARTDYVTELEGYRAAFDSMNKYDFIDTSRVFMVGLSNGGGLAPLVSQQHPVHAFVSGNSWGNTWYEHMLGNERARLTSGGKTSPAEINQQMKAFAEFYNLYLIQRMTPGEAISKHPEWKSSWYDKPDGQYGRPAKFYQDLQALNLGEAWQNVSAPVLVIHGGADTVMTREDSQAIVDTVNRGNPGNARYLEVPGMDHGFAVSLKFHDPLVAQTLEFLRANEK